MVHFPAYWQKNHPEVFCKKGVPESLFNKVAGLKLLAQLFSCKFSAISKNTFSFRRPLVAASVLIWLEMSRM